MDKIVENKGLSFHGEVGIIRADLIGITEVPSDAKEVKPENGLLLIAHSESGHHHYVDATQARFFEGAGSDLCYLQLAGEVAYLKHMKPAGAPDRHHTQSLDAPLYIIKKQREETPEGWRAVAD